VGAEPQNIEALIGRDTRLGVSGAAHISAAGVFRGVINIRAAIRMTTVSLRKLCEHSQMTDPSETHGRFRFDSIAGSQILPRSPLQ